MASKSPECQKECVHCQISNHFKVNGTEVNRQMYYFSSMLLLYSSSQNNVNVM